MIGSQVSAPTPAPEERDYLTTSIPDITAKCKAVPIGLLRRLSRAPLAHRAAPSGPALSGPACMLAGLRAVGGRPIAAPRAAALSPHPLRSPPLLAPPGLRGRAGKLNRILMGGKGSPRPPLAVPGAAAPSSGRVAARPSRPARGWGSPLLGRAPRPRAAL